MKKKHKLIIRGATPHGTTSMPPTLQRIITILDQAEEHESWTGMKLSTEAGAGFVYLRHFGTLLPDGYRFLKKGTYIYASPKTVQNAKEGMYDEG